MASTTKAVPKLNSWLIRKLSGSTLLICISISLQITFCWSESMRYYRTDSTYFWKDRSASSNSRPLFKIRKSRVEPKTWIEILLERIAYLKHSVFSKAVWKIVRLLKTLTFFTFLSIKNFRQSLSRNFSRGKISAKITTFLTIMSWNTTLTTLLHSLLQISSFIQTSSTKAIVFVKIFGLKTFQS